MRTMNNHSTTPDPDGATMAAVAEGDIGGLSDLFERHHGSIYRFFRRAGQRPHPAEDLTQEVFLRVLRFRSSFQRGRSFRPWLFRIARNLLSDHAAISRPEDPIDGARHDAADPAPSPARRLEARDRLARLEAAIASLSVEQRDALLMARFHDLSYRDIGEILGCSEGAVKARVFRALQAISTRLEEGGDASP
jgi:RNA polymerase sigma-70 factor (ECF subfamily)